MPFANFKVPAGTLSAEQKEKIIHHATDLYAEIYGERARGNTLVLVEEVADGGWGIGDQVLTLAVLQGRGDGGTDNSGDTGKSGDTGGPDTPPGGRA
jgi:4-oxalocrotonate tautomerase